MVLYPSRFERGRIKSALAAPGTASPKGKVNILMKHAIIVTGGKQYRVAEGDVIYVEKLDAEEGASIKFEQVLAVIGEEGSTFGAPYVEGASVAATVLKQGKGKKIRVYKMKPKKGYRNTKGHRQPYTKVEIGAIG